MKLNDGVSRRNASTANVLLVGLTRNESILNVGVDLLTNLASTFDNTPLAVEFIIGIISCK